MTHCFKTHAPRISVSYFLATVSVEGVFHHGHSFFFKNNSSLENDLEPFKQPLNCMRCVCRVFLSKIIWNRFMVWTPCQNFGLKENLFSVVKYKSIIQLSLGFQCYSCSQPDALNWVCLSAKLYIPSAMKTDYIIWQLKWKIAVLLSKIWKIYPKMKNSLEKLQKFSVISPKEQK